MLHSIGQRVAFINQKNQVEINGFFILTFPEISFQNPKLSVTIQPVDKSDKPSLLLKISTRFWQEIRPMPYAAELLKHVYEATGDVISIVTARGRMLATETHQLVDKICPAPYRISMVDDHKDKLLHLKGFDTSVEDRRLTAQILTDAGIKVYLVNRPYNQGMEHPHITMIEHLGELLEDLIVDGMK